MQSRFSTTNQLSFIILCVVAGVVNVVGFINVANLSLSHMTGNVSQSAIAFTQGDYLLFAKILSLMLAFILGAALCGFIAKSVEVNKRVLSNLLLLEAVLLLISYLGFHANFFLGGFFASVACGLQNSALASHSQSWVRTTHLTGILSDLGLKLGVLFAKGDINTSKFRLQILLIVAFFWGGVIGTVAYLASQLSSVWISSVIVILIALYFRFSKQ